MMTVMITGNIAPEINRILFCVMVIYSRYKLSSGPQFVLPCVMRLINPFSLMRGSYFERIDSDIYSLKQAAREM